MKCDFKLVVQKFVLRKINIENSVNGENYLKWIVEVYVRMMEEAILDRASPEPMTDEWER